MMVATDRRGESGDETAGRAEGRPLPSPGDRQYESSHECASLTAGTASRTTAQIPLGATEPDVAADGLT